MKRWIIGIAMLAVLSATTVFAATPTDGPHATLGGSSVEKSIFEWTQKPFAFVEFNLEDLADPQEDPSIPYITLTYTWKYGAEKWIYTQNYTDLSDSPTQLQLWSELANWDSLKNGRTGQWTVRTQWSAWDGGGASTNGFTLNGPVPPAPEPISSSLFVLGGALIAARKLKKKV